MSYPLLMLHKLIHESVLANSEATGLEEALHEAAAFPLQFLKSAGEAANGKELKVQVQTTAKGLVCLLNSLYAGETLTEGRRELETALLAALTWLQQYFPLYFDDTQVLPSSLAVAERKMWTLRLQQGKEKEELPSIPAEIAKIIAIAVEKDFYLASTITYRQKSYWDGLYHALNETVPANSLFSAFACEETLIRLNFNTPLFIQYLTGKMSMDIEESFSSTHRLAQWRSRLAWIGSIPSFGGSLYAQYGSVKDTACRFIENEISNLEQKTQTLTAVYGSNEQSKVSAGKENAVVTTLSVSQLAVLCRLLTDCGMLKHNNQTELLKMIAGALQTTRTTAISAESLRVKYYTPDPASVNIVKEHLLQMLGQLKKY